MSALIVVYCVDILDEWEYQIHCLTFQKEFKIHFFYLKKMSSLLLLTQEHKYTPHYTVS